MELTVRELEFAYPNGVQALRGVTATIRQGERVAIIGRNGSGKTTLVKHLIGLLRPSRGRVLIGDWDAATRTTAQLARRIGFLFQNPDEQIFQARVWDEVAFGPRQLRLPLSDIDARVRASLERTELAALANVNPYELLPAQRKWVALASVLALDTPVLILDEPTTGQDARGLARLGALVDQLAREGRTVIAVSHDMDFCAEHFERVVVMREGEILADGPAREVLARADLLAATSVEPPHITRLGSALQLPAPVLSVEEFVAALKHARTRAAQTS